MAQEAESAPQWTAAEEESFAAMLADAPRLEGQRLRNLQTLMQAIRPSAR